VRLLRITQRLYACTWAAGARGFRADHAPPSPLLALYIDRTAMRLPFAALLPLLKGVRCKIRVALPSSLSAEEARVRFSKTKDTLIWDDVYVVDFLVASRRLAGTI